LPNDRKLTFRFEYLDIAKNKTVRIYKGTYCKQCPDRMSCSKNSRDGKVIKDYEGWKQKEGKWHPRCFQEKEY